MTPPDKEITLPDWPMLVEMASQSGRTTGLLEAYDLVKNDVSHEVLIKLLHLITKSAEARPNETK